MCKRGTYLIGERCDDAAPQQPSDARLMCVQFQPLDDRWRPVRNTKPLTEPSAARSACRTQYVWAHAAHTYCDSIAEGSGFGIFVRTVRAYSTVHRRQPATLAPAHPVLVAAGLHLAAPPQTVHRCVPWAALPGQASRSMEREML